MKPTHYDVKYLFLLFIFENHGGWYTAVIKTSVYYDFLVMVIDLKKSRPLYQIKTMFFVDVGMCCVFDHVN